MCLESTAKENTEIAQSSKNMFFKFSLHYALVQNNGL